MILLKEGKQAKIQYYKKLDVKVLGGCDRFRVAFSTVLMRTQF